MSCLVNLCYGNVMIMVLIESERHVNCALSIEIERNVREKRFPLSKQNFIFRVFAVIFVSALCGVRMRDGSWQGQSTTYIALCFILSRTTRRGGQQWFDAVDHGAQQADVFEMRLTRDG